MKILYIATAFAKYEKDAITPWLTKTVDLLNKSGENIDVDVLTSSYKGTQDHTINDFTVHRFRYFFKPLEFLTHEKNVPEKLKESWLMWFLVPFYMFFGTLATIKLVIKNDYDIVHVHWPFPHFVFATVAKIFSSFKIVSTYHSVGPKWVKDKLPFLKPFFSFIQEYSDLITVNSTYTLNVVKPYGGGPFTIIPFGAAIEVEGKDFNKDPRKVLFVGRLVERKGVEYLIKSIRRVKEEIPEVHLHIVGDGPVKNQLKRIIKDYNLTQSISLEGRIPQAQLIEHYKTSSVFVLPAIIDSSGDTEGLGVVLLEALMYRNAVIASEVGGIVDIVKHNKSGLLVPQKDIKALSEALINLLNNDSRRNRLADDGHKYVEENFSWNTIIEKLIDSYKNLLK